MSSRVRWPRVAEVFDQAQSRSPEHRPGLLSELCADQPEIRAEVESLLDAHESAGGFLEGNDADLTAKRLAFAQFAGLEGQTMGPYRLIREIGRGGMGSVYLASRRDAEIKRQVAVKLMDSSVADEAFLARFRRERQILADLSHPNIAHLYEAGTAPDGTLYFAMELVEGLPIDDYCDQARLTVTERLDLFRAICEAVQYAHRSLVIHRDIKPSNILVTREGQPKLLDFGIAKALDREEDQEPTRTASRVLTPSYASPEQLLGEPVTTESDVYSLGVLLYKLLTGSLPRPAVDLRSGVAQTFAKDVSAPSCALAHHDDATRQAVEALALHRKTTPSRLRRALQGDLDNIVLKALRTERERRYSTVDRLARDIERFRAGLPVEARPDSVRYRLTKFVGRNRITVALGAAICAVVLVSGISLAVMAGRIRAERDQAARDRDEARQVSDLMVKLFETAEPGRPGRAVTARELLEQGVASISISLEEQPLVEATMLDAIGRAYVGLALYPEALPLFARSLELRRSDLGGDHPVVATSLVRLGALQRIMDDIAPAAENFEEAARIQRASGPDNPALALTLAHLGEIAQVQGDYSESDRLIREGLRITRLTSNHSPEHALQLGVLAASRSAHGDLAAAREIWTEAIEVGASTLGDQHTEVLSMKRGLASILSRENRLVEAEVLYRQILEAERQLFDGDHVELAFTQSHLGTVLVYQGRAAEGERFLREALRMRRKLLGSEHLAVAVSLGLLGSAEVMLGDLSSAEHSFRQALAILRGRNNPAPRQLGYVLNGLGRVLRAGGRYEPAEAALREAFRLRLALLGEGHPLVVETQGELALCVLAGGESEEATALLAQASSSLLALEGALPPNLGRVANELVDYYEGAGRREDALLLRRRLN